MKIISFFGYSDDTFCWESSHSELKDIDCFEKTAIVELYSPTEAHLSKPSTMLVIGDYTNNDTACWTVGISQKDEGDPIPEWPISVKQHKSGYSIILQVCVPDDVEIKARAF
jgi:hypothetical protein